MTKKLSIPQKLFHFWMRKEKELMQNHAGLQWRSVRKSEKEKLLDSFGLPLGGSTTPCLPVTNRRFLMWHPGQGKMVRVKALHTHL